MIHQLEADSIQLEFGQRKVLSDIYLTCQTGQITGLLGRNGQGKSCLMKIIYGTVSCEKSVRIDKRAYFEAYKNPEIIRYLPQFNFIPPFLPLNRIFRQFSLDYLDFETRFPEFSSRYKDSIGKLSGGERRLVELYVIVMSPSLFALLDEPFTHLNPLQIEKGKELLVSRKSSKGLLISDHMYHHVLDICDEVYILADGKTHLTKSRDDIERLGYARS